MDGQRLLILTRTAEEEDVLGVQLCLRRFAIDGCSAYEPNSRHLREVLIVCFNVKKSAAEAHRILSNTYGEAAISERTCREWFQRFKNGGFDVED
ncbi:solute carrier family 23 member 1 [Trichonephila clavipes]|nr:solute carrier family 23 member 1 [Trichonephila clavipes]